MPPEVLRVATYNCNSIRARLDVVLDRVRAEEPDILCLQETRTQDSESPGEAFSELAYQARFRGQKAHAGVH